MAHAGTHSHWISALVPEGFTARQLIFASMLTIFLTCLIVANFVGSVLFSFPIAGQQPLFSAGIIFFPITFLLTDLLNEFYGTRAARFVTLLGLMASLFVYALMTITEQLPMDARSLLSREEFLKFSNLYTAMVGASLTAYIVGQLLDIQVFDAFHRLTRQRYIWLRAQGSTIISQAFDSFIVVWIAFGGKLDVDSIWQIGWSNYVWKILIVTAITPLLYLGHALLRRAIAPKPVTPAEN